MSAKVSVLGAGSLRRGGNTENLVDEVLRGVKDAGAATEKVVLAQANMGSCRACNMLSDRYLYTEQRYVGYHREEEGIQDLDPCQDPSVILLSEIIEYLDMKKYRVLQATSADSKKSTRNDTALMEAAHAAGFDAVKTLI